MLRHEHSARNRVKIKRRREQADGKQRLPSAIFSDAGDTLRVSPGPLPAFLIAKSAHSPFTVPAQSKITHNRLRKAINFGNLAHSFEIPMAQKSLTNSNERVGL